MTITAFPMQAEGIEFGESPMFTLLDHVMGAGVATGLEIVQNPGGADMSVTALPGSAYVALDDGGKRLFNLSTASNSGVPGLKNAAEWISTFPAAHPSMPTVHRVVSQVQDNLIDGSGETRGMLSVVAGTPTVGASLATLSGTAALPDGCEHLAFVVVPAGATVITNANIDCSPRAASVGQGSLTPAWDPGDTKWSFRPVPSVGWLKCDASAVSRVEYADLFAAIGTAYGAGDGATTFNVPDAQGRSLIAAGAGSGLTARTLGAKLGVETHVLSVGEMPSHAHGGATGGATAAIQSAEVVNHFLTPRDGGQFVQTSGTASTRYAETTATPAAQYTTAIPSSTGSYYSRTNTADSGILAAVITQNNHTHTIGSQGGGAAHQNMQPSLVANLFIKS